MEELREEVGVRESRQGKNGGAEGGGWCERVRWKLVRSRLKWAGQNGRGSVDGESK